MTSLKDMNTWKATRYDCEFWLKKEGSFETKQSNRQEKRVLKMQCVYKYTCRRSLMIVPLNLNRDTWTSDIKIHVKFPLVLKYEREKLLSNQLLSTTTMLSNQLL